MADSGGGKVTFSGGAVSGASSVLYNDDNTTISVTYAAPVGYIVGYAGGFDHPKFNPTDVNIGGFETKVLGIGVGASLSYNREYNAPAFSVDASFNAGGTFTVITPGLNPFEWHVTTNGYATLSTGHNVGVFGVGVGGTLELTADEGAIIVGGNLSFGLAGLTSGTVAGCQTGAGQRPAGLSRRAGCLWRRYFGQDEGAKIKGQNDAGR